MPRAEFAALLAGEKVGFYSEFPWEGELPKGLIWCQKTGISLSEIQYETVDGTPLPEVGIAVTVHKSCHPFASTTHVVPPAAALGMGCRKNKESEAVEKAAFSCLKENARWNTAGKRMRGKKRWFPSLKILNGENRPSSVWKNKIA